jgi:hypothetical protein
VNTDAGCDITVTVRSFIHSYEAFPFTLPCTGTTSSMKHRCINLNLDRESNGSCVNRVYVFNSVFLIVASLVIGGLDKRFCRDDDCGSNDSVGTRIRAAYFNC